MTARIGAASLARLLPRSWRLAAPAYAALADAVRLLVLDGRLPLDVRVPSERELAVALGVSRTTVTAAYERLRDEGFLISRQGAGSWTATPLGARGPAPDSPVLRPAAPGELPDGTVDLSTATLGAGPVVHAAYAAALSEMPRHLPGSGYVVGGLPVLREAVAEWYRRRGVPTRADEVFVTSGAMHAVSLALRVLVEQGDRVLVEHPTYPNALEAVRRSGGRPVPVDVGAHPAAPGWDLESVAATVRQSAPVAGYVVPDFHNPTGTCQAAADREAFVRLAAGARTTLVVDESLVELWFDRPPPPSTATLGGADRVVTVGGLGKVFWAGMRIGWIRADRALLRRVATVRMSADMTNPVIDQLAAAHLLTSPQAGDAVAERRAMLRQLRERLAAGLRRHLPEWRWPVPAGGLSLWAQLDAPVSSAMAALAGRHGVRLAAGTLFGLDGAFDGHLRVPLVPVPIDADEVARRLAAVRAEVHGSTVGRLWDVIPVA
jgi:DNA-binding transcriptional MocR family regulator